MYDGKHKGGIAQFSFSWALEAKESAEDAEVGSLKGLRTTRLKYAEAQWRCRSEFLGLDPSCAAICSGSSEPDSLRHTFMPTIGSAASAISTLRLLHEIGSIMPDEIY